MLKVEEVNALERHQFTDTFARLFEHSPWIAARTAGKRPFRDRDEFHAALCETVMKATEEEKVALVRAHPDLVGRDILTPESQSEQADAGLISTTPEEAEKFRTYNEQY